MTLVPIFTSHYSIGNSLLTLDEPQKATPGGPLSVFDIAQEGGLKEVVLVEDRIDGFITAYKNATKLGLKLCYGLKMTVCQDIEQKDESSFHTESKAIIFITNTSGYSDLIRIHNRASNEGFYYRPRTDWGIMKTMWTPNLLLALPFFSSFIARNTLSMSRIVPDLPVSPSVFIEQGSEIPFAPLIEKAIEKFCHHGRCNEWVDTKSVYYHDRASFKAYQIMRCHQKRSKWDKPNLDHLASDAFCWESYHELIKLTK